MSSNAASFLDVSRKMMVGGLSKGQLKDMVEACAAIMDGKGLGPSRLANDEEGISSSESLTDGSSLSGCPLVASSSGKHSASSERRRKKREMSVRSKQESSALSEVPGFSYLLFLKSVVSKKWAGELGRGPTMLEVLRIPLSEFKPVVQAGWGPTVYKGSDGTWEVDLRRSKGYSLANCAYTLRSYGAPGVSDGWRMIDMKEIPSFGVNAKFSSEALEDIQLGDFGKGYCYLKLFPKHIWREVAIEFGESPGLIDLIQHSVGANPQARLRYVDNKLWHVLDEVEVGSSDVQWIALVRACLESAVVCYQGKFWSRKSLEGHRVAGNSSKLEKSKVSPTRETKPEVVSVDGESAGTSARLYLSWLWSYSCWKAANGQVREGCPSPPLLLYLQPKDPVLLNGHRKRSSFTVSVEDSPSYRENGIAWVSIRYDHAGRGVAVLPGEWLVRCRGVTVTAKTKEKLVVTAGEAEFELGIPVKGEADPIVGHFLVRLLTADTWAEWCRHPDVLPRKASMHRAAYLWGVPVAMGNPIDSRWVAKFGGRVLGKLGMSGTDGWASDVSTFHRRVGGDLSIKAYAAESSSVVCATNVRTAGIRIFPGKGVVVKVDAGESVLFGGVPYVRAIPAEIGLYGSMELKGVADEYTFDGGGPSDGESHVSGEVFGEYD